MKALSARKSEDVASDGAAGGDDSRARGGQVVAVDHYQRLSRTMLRIRVEAAADATAGGVRIVFPPVFVSPTENIGEKRLGASQLIRVREREFDVIDLIRVMRAVHQDLLAGGM